MEPQKRQVIIASGVLFILLIVAGVIFYELHSPNGLYARGHADLTKAVAGRNAPYTDLSGATVDLAFFQGKPLVVNVWASWSPFSKDELPLLARMHERYGDTVTIVAMNRKEDKTRARAYLAYIGDPKGPTYLIDPTDHFYNTVAGFAMPETIFYNATGNIVGHVRGVLTEEGFVNQINALLKK